MQSPYYTVLICNVQAHGRAWASAKEGNVYARANPEQWLESVDDSGEVLGLPVDVHFWDELFANAREWGCLQYQQDWMYTPGLAKNRVLSCCVHTRVGKNRTSNLKQHDCVNKNNKGL